MPSTKAIDPPVAAPTKPHRRTWWFRGGGGGGASHTTKKMTMEPSNVTPKTNNLRPSTANDPSSTTSSANNNTTTTHPTSVTGILRKDTKDYDAVIASKRHQEQIQNTSWFCRTRYFQNMCRVAFDAIDSDGSGTMDEKELYAGLLLLHLQLGMYAGPAACRPLSREQVHTVFCKMDTDQSGALDVQEFQAIMSVLFSNVLLRVIVQWSMTLMIVPWLAQFILSVVVTVITYIANVIANLDEHSAFFNFVELTIEGIMDFIYRAILPNFVKVILSMIQRGVRMVPVSVWKALPLTILSTVLGIVVVPYCIFQIDFYFQSLADRHHQRQLNRQNRLNGSSNSTADPTNALIYKSKSLYFLFINMTDRIFPYDESLLQGCATSPVALSTLEQSDGVPNRFDDRDVDTGQPEATINSSFIDANDQYCKTLLRLYMEHYDRHYSNSLIYITRNTMNLTHNNRSYQVGRTMRNFIQNVITIHLHNSRPDQQGWHHRLRLNRFSDQNLQHLFRGNNTTQPASINRNETKKSRRLRQVASEELHRSIESMKVPLVHLSSFEEIQKFGMEWYPKYTARRRHGFVKQIDKYTKRQHTDHLQFNLYPSKLRLPTDDMISDNENDDDEKHNSPTNATKQFYKSTDKGEMDGALVYIGRNKRKYAAQQENDIFANNINWATVNNPDGVPIVHDPVDQGNCGSCWALSATGSIEANAARRSAYTTFHNTILTLTDESATPDPTDSIRMAEIYHNATLLAQNVERQSIDRLNLSIQELIDCDTAVDQGCVGGNPLLAFYFVHKYGVTSADQYPYVGVKGKCRKRSANVPIATVTSWGILPPNSERHMELVIRYIGPIAVGFNGGDPTFLSYSGGIYHSQNCHHRSNHALLVVGYGEEEIVDQDGSKVNVPYWIARNSWGTGWGELGYVRILRGKGGKGEPGQCGIACSPSVALGGTLLEPVHGIIDGGDGDRNDIQRINDLIEANGSYHPLETVVPYTMLEKVCLQLGHPLDDKSPCGVIADYVSTHRATVLCSVGLLTTLLLVVWPLTWDCRRRAHGRRMRKHQQQQFERENDMLMEAQPDETSALITPNGVADVTYGCNGSQIMVD